VKSALRWQDEHPAEALAARRRYEQARREEQDRADALAEWTLAGKDVADFDRRYKELKADADAAELRDMTEGARERFARAVRRSF
jgi:hypothetical protein